MTIFLSILRKISWFFFQNLLLVSGVFRSYIFDTFSVFVSLHKSEIFHIIVVVILQYECQPVLPFILFFLSLYRNLPFVISVKVFLRGNCYALPLSYCRCIPSFCIGINLLLRTLMFEVLVCLWLYINTQVVICQHFFQINFKYFYIFLWIVYFIMNILTFYADICSIVSYACISISFVTAYG